MSSAIHKLDFQAREAFLQLASAADAFERYANPHASRLAAISVELARVFHIGRQDRSSLQTAALLHDLGEVAMEREYIHRNGPLIDEEHIDLARHPLIGEKEAARAGADRPAQLLVRWHHEWWNGSGYPDSLRAEEIPLAARILRVADSYSALTDDRPYRRALTVEAAKKMIVERAGIEFDPVIVQAFLSLPALVELQSFAKRDASALLNESGQLQ